MDDAYPRVQMSARAVAEIVARALAEDVGEGDVTTAATVAADARARATICQKAPGVVYGVDVAIETFRTLDPRSSSSGSLTRARGGIEGQCWRSRGRPERS